MVEQKTTTIKVLYSCKACGAERVKVEVRERYPNEDLNAWVQRVVIALCGLHHSIRSPLCAAGRFDVWLPADNPRGVGYKLLAR